MVFKSFSICFKLVLLQTRTRGFGNPTSSSNILTGMAGVSCLLPAWLGGACRAEVEVEQDLGDGDEVHGRDVLRPTHFHSPNIRINCLSKPHSNDASNGILVSG